MWIKLRDLWRPVGVLGSLFFASCFYFSSDSTFVLGQQDTVPLNIRSKQRWTIWRGGMNCVVVEMVRLMMMMATMQVLVVRQHLPKDDWRNEASSCGRQKGAKVYFFPFQCLAHSTRNSGNIWSIEGGHFSLHSIGPGRPANTKVANVLPLNGGLFDHLPGRAMKIGLCLTWASST